MKKILMMGSLLVITLMIACDQNQQKEIDIQTTITDTEGTPVKEVYAGMTLQLSSEFIRDLNKQRFFQNGGQLLVDGLPAKIQIAQGSIVVLTLPILYYVINRDISMRLASGGNSYRLCRACVLYRPTVTGVPLSGIAGGSTDGTYNLPAEMTLDRSGNLYVIDQRLEHDVIIKVTPAGVASVFAGHANEFGRLTGIGIDATRGLLLLQDATAQKVLSMNLTSPATVSVLAGSGTTGNVDGVGTAASFSFGTQWVNNFGTNEQGQGLAVDASGNVFVAENYPGTGNSQIRRITPTGVVTTVPGSRVVVSGEAAIVLPTDLTLNSAGEFLNTCGGVGSFHGIGSLNSSSVLSRFVGQDGREGLNDGNGSVSKFSYPKALQYQDGYYFVADGTNGALRRVTTGGDVTTLAGVGHFLTPTFCGCGIRPAATAASYVMPGLLATRDEQELAARAIKMDQVGGVAAQSAGLIYVSDYGYRCIWKVTIR
jgi:hypothetical protein